MQKLSHFYERAFLLGGWLLRYAVACDGYAGANYFSTGRPVARCAFGNIASGLPS